MRRLSHVASPCLAFLLLLGPLKAQNLRAPAFMKRARQGFDLVFNMDYDEAETLFQDLARDYPQHPAPPLYLAVITWLRELLARQEMDLGHFISPAYFTHATGRVMPAAERRAFFTRVERSMDLSRKILKARPQDEDARYFLGTANGILASFSITIDRSKSKAFSYGKKAYHYHRKLVDEDPLYYDAYMSVGLYEYIVGSLPWYIKWIAAIAGYHGSKERGLEALAVAVQKGRWVSDDARVLQMVLLVREKRYPEALEQARYLHAHYPHNYLLHLNVGQILEWMGQKEEALKRYRRVLEWAEEGRANYSRLPLPPFRYGLAQKLNRAGKRAEALELFQRSARDGRTPERLRALSLLAAAEIEDGLGHREQALAYYRQVLELPEYGHSHRRARRGMERPGG